jgi:predicted lactoylglutathione lyase
MIGYTTVGTNDLTRAAAFYDALLAELNATRQLVLDRTVMWGTAAGSPMFGVIRPFDGKPATVGNGAMWSFFLDTPAKVDHMYRRAIELGGTDEGAPGERFKGFYAAYFRDLDGNKIAFFNMG